MNNGKLVRSGTSLTADSKGRPLNIPEDVLSFLELITKPKSLKHTAPLTDFIKNEVLRDIRKIITRCNSKRSY